MNNTSMAYVLGAVVILVLIGGAYYFGTQEAVAPTQESGEQQGKMTAPAWTLTQQGEDQATGAPMTEVSVTFAGKTEVLGTEMGSCFVVEESAWALLDGELSGVICYFAGGGVEYGVFRDGEGYVVRKGHVEEGSAEVAGGRAGFETVLAF